MSIVTRIAEVHLPAEATTTSNLRSDIAAANKVRAETFEKAYDTLRRRGADVDGTLVGPEHQGKDGEWRVYADSYVDGRLFVSVYEPAATV